MHTFQARVAPWMLECFGEAIAKDQQERSARFLEESLELVQAAGFPREHALQLIDYVYGRPVGELGQEVGGVMVTLAALGLAHGIDVHHEAERELARIWTKIDVIRAKQAAKPKGSPLPAEPVGGWRCFHCDEVFIDYFAARNHFGHSPEDGAPVCRVDGGTAREIYHLRRRLEQYQNEDTDLHRQIASLQSGHATALRRAEELGYERGLADGRAMVESEQAQQT